jgi:hypothetical protein
MSESVEQMHKRLCSVIAAARFEVLSQPYAWEQVSEPSRLPANALAVVRDGSAWYALTSVPANAKGAYRILVFHFAEGLNASGFVAWLAGIMRKEAGTGVMVVCGFDGCRGVSPSAGSGPRRWIRERGPGRPPSPLGASALPELAGTSRSTRSQ